MSHLAYPTTNMLIWKAAKVDNLKIKKSFDQTFIGLSGKLFRVFSSESLQSLQRFGTFS